MKPARIDRAWVLDRFGVSRETAVALDGFIDLLLIWNRTINLIGASTASDVWARHVADSAQLVLHAPEARRWIDLGSGAGFPGMVIGLLLRDRPDFHIELVEANAKKAAFLREAARRGGVPATIRAERIAVVVTAEHLPVDVVTARALAPLAQLVAWAEPLLKEGAVGLFPKGRDVQSELTALGKLPRLLTSLLPSLTEPRAGIVRVEIDSGW